MVDFAYLGQTILNGLSVGCIYGLIGIGFCVIYNASGIVNFAQGAFVMLGGMLTYILISYHVPFILAAILATAAVAIAGVIIERIVVRPLWDRKATMFVMILATLAVQIVIVALAVFFQKTLVGRAMRACAINREAAALQGIQVSQMLAFSFALSAALGSIAGILVTPTQFTAFNVGTPFAISGFIAAIVGGFGRPFGAFLGGLTLGLAQALAVFSLGSGLKNMAALSVLLIFLFLRPSGILGSAK